MRIGYRIGIAGRLRPSSWAATITRFFLFLLGATAHAQSAAGADVISRLDAVSVAAQPGVEVAYQCENAATPIRDLEAEVVKLLELQGELRADGGLDSTAGVALEAARQRALAIPPRLALGAYTKLKFDDRYVQRHLLDVAGSTLYQTNRSVVSPSGGRREARHTVLKTSSYTAICDQVGGGEPVQALYRSGFRQNVPDGLGQHLEEVRSRLRGLCKALPQGRLARDGMAELDAEILLSRDVVHLLPYDFAMAPSRVVLIWRKEGGSAELSAEYLLPDARVYHRDSIAWGPGGQLASLSFETGGATAEPGGVRAAYHIDELAQKREAVDLDDFFSWSFPVTVVTGDYDAADIRADSMLDLFAKVGDGFVARDGEDWASPPFGDEEPDRMPSTPSPRAATPWMQILLLSICGGLVLLIVYRSTQSSS